MKPKKKKKWFMCVCIKPREEDSYRLRYHMLKASSFKKALKLYAIAILGIKKRTFKKKNICDYYYCDGLVFIQRLFRFKSWKGVQHKDLYATGYLYELCKECRIRNEKIHDTKEEKFKKKKKKKKRGGLL